MHRRFSVKYVEGRSPFPAQVGVYYAQRMAFSIPVIPAATNRNASTGDTAVRLRQLTSYHERFRERLAHDRIRRDFKWGPYLSQMPVNPVNSLATIIRLRRSLRGG